mgnify:CR=1 FL=1
MLLRLAVAAALALLIIGLTKLFTPNGGALATAVQSASIRNPASAMAGAWNGEINYAPAYAALDPLTALASAEATSLFDPQDDYWGLPRANGYEEVAAYCTACHSLRIVMQQRQPREGWDYLLNWMVEKQGMAPPPADDRALLLDYLSQEFGDD